MGVSDQGIWPFWPSLLALMMFNDSYVSHTGRAVKPDGFLVKIKAGHGLDTLTT